MHAHLPPLPPPLLHALLVFVVCLITVEWMNPELERMQKEVVLV